MRGLAIGRGWTVVLRPSASMMVVVKSAVQGSAASPGRQSHVVPAASRLPGPNRGPDPADEVGEGRALELQPAISPATTMTKATHRRVLVRHLLSTPPVIDPTSTPARPAWFTWQL
jgi:hypothetical protein